MLSYSHLSSTLEAGKSWDGTRPVLGNKPYLACYTLRFSL